MFINVPMFNDRKKNTHTKTKVLSNKRRVDKFYVVKLAKHISALFN